MNEDAQPGREWTLTALNLMDELPGDLEEPRERAEAQREGVTSALNIIAANVA